MFFPFFFLFHAGYNNAADSVISKKRKNNNNYFNSARKKTLCSAKATDNEEGCTGGVFRMDMFMCCNIRKQTGIPESKPDEVRVACIPSAQDARNTRTPVV
jgi:hypothetical protein